MWQRLRLITLVLFAGLAVLCGYGMTQLKFEFSFEAFMPEDDPDIRFYQSFKERFKKGGSNVTVAIHREAGVFDRDFLERVDRFCKRVRRLPDVTGVQSLTNLRDYIYTPGIPIRERVLDWRNSTDLRADSVRIVDDLRMRNTFVSGTGQLLAVHIGLPRRLEDSTETRFNNDIHALLAEMDFERYHVVGFAIAHHEITKLQKQQFSTYVLIATLVMFVIMMLLFRRFWGIVIAFVSVFLGMAFFFGMMGLIQKPLDLMATLFPVLLVIVGTSDVVHIMTKYVDELRRGKAKAEALKITIKEIGLATFLTSLTTAVGFLSLYTSRMPPIRGFGLFAAMGVFIAFITVILMTTAVISWFRADQLMFQPRGKGGFERLLETCYEFTQRHARKILLGTVVIMLLCGVLASTISFSLTSQRDLPRRSRILADFKAVDAELKGVNAIDLALETVGDRDFYDLEVLQQVAGLEAYLAQQEQLGPVYAPTTFFKIANRAWNSNLPEFYTLPADQSTLDRQREVLDRHLKSQMLSMVSADGKSANMYIKVQDIGSAKIAGINAGIDDWIASNVDSTQLKFTHTGHRHIFDKNQERLVGSLLISLGLAFFAVSFFMALVFRNLRMVLVSLVPNIVPLLFTAGLIGLLQLEMDPKIAIVFTIAFGIAVDDSIHFLARFKLEKDKGKSLEDAIKATFLETGKAIVITTLILFFGFASLVLSVFPPTYTIGLLLSVTLALALVADFLLIPLLLRWLIK